MTNGDNSTKNTLENRVVRFPVSKDNKDVFLAEARLMQRIAQGDSQAFRQLVEKHIGGMVCFATQMTGQPDIAEDMVQQAFTNAWKFAPRWQQKARLSTWLFSILRNECLQYLRKNKTGLQKVSDVDVVLTDDQRLPDAALEYKDDKAALDAAMAKLPERQRTALYLRYGKELKQKEAAHIMGVTEKALESLLSRGKAQLKQIMMGNRDD